MKKIKFLINTCIVVSLFVFISGCNKDDSDDNPPPSNTPPISSFIVSPQAGYTLTTFHFDASNSIDNKDDTTDLQFRWDWENNGLWDEEWSLTKLINHQFPDEGIYRIVLEVMDSQGLTDTTSISVKVSNTGGGTGEPCPGIPSFNYGGQVYNTTLIGSQCWMKENLNYNTGNSWCYNNNDLNCEIYGRLYDWQTVMNGEPASDLAPSRVRGICPDEWHVPSDQEWKILEGMVDTQYGVGDSIWNDETLFIRGFDAGRRLKSATSWFANYGTDMFNFNAKPGGIRKDEGSFDFIETHSYFWSSTGLDNWGIIRYLRYDINGVVSGWSSGGNAASLRCIKD